MRLKVSTTKSSRTEGPGDIRFDTTGFTGLSLRLSIFSVTDGVDQEGPIVGDDLWCIRRREQGWGSPNPCIRRQSSGSTLFSRHPGTAECVASLRRSQNWRRNDSAGTRVEAGPDPAGFSITGCGWLESRTGTSAVQSCDSHSDGDCAYVQPSGVRGQGRWDSGNLREIRHRIDRGGGKSLTPGGHLFSTAERCRRIGPSATAVDRCAYSLSCIRFVFI